MILDPILPEISTFIDFTTHGCFTAKKKGYQSYTTHLAGEIPAEHPMPYNVYVPIREFLHNNQAAQDALIQYLDEEFHKDKYDFKRVKIETSVYSHRKTFGRSKNYPQIDVTLEW